MLASQLQSAAAQFQKCVKSNEQTVNVAHPAGLAIDHNGNVWVVTDRRSSELYEISPGGSIIGKPVSTGMNARGLTIAPNGYIWVVAEASPKVDPDVPEPKTGSQSAMNRLWGGSSRLRVYNDNGTLVGKVKYMDFNISQPPSTILKRTSDWRILDNLVFTASGKYTNLSATLTTKDSEHKCTQCVAVGAAPTEGHLVRDFDLTGEPWDCAAGTIPGAIGGDGGSGLRYAAFSPDGLLWRSWDAGMFAIDLKHGAVKHKICAKAFKLIGRFAISADGTIWAYAPMEHGVINFTANGTIIQNFAGVGARDIAIDHDGNIWAVAAGRIVEIVGAARKPPYFPYDFNLPSAPQWP
ncbi:MAG: NHL repeat-containing protein [Acidiferrobacteraceae bacterium]